MSAIILQLPPPRFAWVALTNRCNLACDHCQRGTLAQQGLLPPRDMPEAIFDKLEEQVFPHLARIQFGGNNFGEPLLARHWDDYFERVCAFPMQISLVCNATLLNERRIERLSAACVELNFSLEGATAESYERCRGHSFERFCELVAMTCRQKNAQRDGGARVNLGFTARRSNIAELPAVVELAARLGADRVTMTHFVPWHERQRRESLVYHRTLTNAKLAEASKLGRRLGILVDLPAPFAESPDAGDDGAPTSVPCRHPWQSVSISEVGEVMPCCATSVVLGDLARDDLSCIWTGKRYRKLRATVNGPRPLGFCRDCGLRGVDVGSQDAVAFSNAERALLGTIGVDSQQRRPAALRRVKLAIARRRLGRVLLPAMNHLYRRHLAFYT